MKRFAGKAIDGQIALFTLLVCGVCLLLCLVSSPCFAQVTFERTYGATAREYGHSVQQTSDGGYIVAGDTKSFGAGQNDIYLIRTDSLGDILWTRTYRGSDPDRAYSVQKTRDAGFVISGETISSGTGVYDVYLVRVDSLGDTLWTATYGGDESDAGYSVLQTLDGGYIIAGETGSFGVFGRDVYLVKTDSLGNLVWATTCGEDSSDDVGRCIVQSSDKGYAVVGGTHSVSGSADVYLIKMDTLGNVLWTRSYGGTEEDFGFSVLQTADGGYTIAGYTFSSGAGWHDVYLIRVDSLGDSLWARTYGGVSSDVAYSAASTSDGGYIIAGAKQSPGWFDVYLVRTDSVGDTLWTRTYGGYWDDMGRSVLQTLDGGFIVVGATWSFGAGNYDFYLIKTDSLGRVLGIQEQDRKSKIEDRKSLQNQPNPFHGSTLISYSLPAATCVTIEVYDITGRLVEIVVNETQKSGIHQVRWNRKANSCGVYFYRLKAGEFVETKKMVVVE